MSDRYHRLPRFVRVRRRLARDEPARPLSSGAVTSILLWIVAAVLLFEEWFWIHSTRAMARFAVMAHLTAVGDWIRRRPPGQALALFALPVVAIYPFKVLALIALARGEIVLGGGALVAAKLVATAVFARLYELTEPAIIQFGWIRAGRAKFLRARAFIHAWLEARPAYRRARTVIRRQAAHLAYRYRVAHRLQGRRRRAGRSGYRSDARVLPVQRRR
jgi:hypothetical protein